MMTDFIYEYFVESYTHTNTHAYVCARAFANTKKNLSTVMVLRYNYHTIQLNGISFR